MQGDDCTAPITVLLTTGASYTGTHQTTCGLGYDYHSTCLGNCDNGEDIMYEPVVNQSGDICVNISVTSHLPTERYFGVAVDLSCPPSGSCLAFGLATDSHLAVINGLTLSGNTAYYMLIDTWPTPFCLADFTVQITPCPKTAPLGKERK